MHDDTNKVSKEQLVELRARTNVGWSDCKKALQEAAGDVDKAIKIMREQGIARAAKKAGRVAPCGCIMIETNHDDSVGVMIEVNCETDFSQRNEYFQAYAKLVAKIALAKQESKLEKLLQMPLDELNGESLEQRRQALVGKIGENVLFRRLVLLRAPEGGQIAYYVHSGRIGALLSLSIKNPELGKEIALHITASSPQFVQESDVPQAILESERKLFEEQARQSGKPDAVIIKMVKGRIEKFLAGCTLVEQPFVRDQDVKVGDLLQKSKANVLAFMRFELGEGIEKQGSDR